MEKENFFRPEDIERSIKEKGYYVISNGTQIRVGIIHQCNENTKPNRKEDISTIILWRDIYVGTPLTYINSSISLHLISIPLLETRELLKIFEEDLNIKGDDYIQKEFQISEKIHKYPDLLKKKEMLEEAIEFNKDWVNKQFLSESGIPIEDYDICDINIYLHIEK